MAIKFKAKHYFSFSLALLCLLFYIFDQKLAVPFTRVGSNRNIIFKSDFENASFSGWASETCCRYSKTIVSSPVRSGNKAARFELRKGTERSEVRQKRAKTNGEYWYGWSVLIPNDFVSDPSFDIISQFHDYQGSNNGWWGKAHRHLPLYFKTQNGNWYVRGTYQQYPNQKITQTFVKNIGTYTKGKWTDFVVHAKWSYKSDGFIRVWKDGQLVFSKNGSVYYNLPQGPYLKVGIYKGDPDWPGSNNISDRVVYFDEIRIGGESAKYEDVAPHRRKLPWNLIS